MLDAIGALGRLPTTAMPRSSTRPRPPASPPASVSNCSRSRPRTTSPATTRRQPEGQPTSPRRLAGLAAMLRAGVPVRVVALSHGMYDTHDDQPEELADGLKLTADSLRPSSGTRSARARRPRRRPRLVGVRPPREGERLERTDHGAAGAGFLIGSRVNGTMIGEFPGLAKLDAQGNLLATSDFRGLYSALLEQWLGGTPRRSSRARAVLPAQGDPIS